MRYHFCRTRCVRRRRIAERFTVRTDTPQDQLTIIGRRNLQELKYTLQWYSQVSMRNLRAICVWLILLLFVSGIASPRLLAATSRPDCPMMRADQELLCRAIPKPEPTKPACCVEQESRIARAGSIAGNCCCDMTAAPERNEVPVLLTVVSDPVALPTTAVASPTPRVASIDSIVRHRADETAPRGPPLRTSSPRAPPLS